MINHRKVEKTDKVIFRKFSQGGLEVKFWSCVFSYFLVKVFTLLSIALRVKRMPVLAIVLRKVNLAILVN